MSDATAGIIFDRLEHWATVKPDQAAMTFQGTEFTWAQWRGPHLAYRRRPRRIRHRCRRHCRVRRQESSVPCLEVTYAASLLGAANVVPNWRLSSEELDYVLADCGARILFVGSELLPQVVAMRDRLTAVESIFAVGGEHDEFEPWIAEVTPLHSRPEVSPDATALVLYSSGRPVAPRVSSSRIEPVRAQQQSPRNPAGPRGSPILDRDADVPRRGTC